MGAARGPRSPGRSCRRRHSPRSRSACAAQTGLLARRREPYVIVAVGLAFALAIWSLATEFSMTGDVAPLPYFPLLNPVDVVQLFVLLMLWRCWRVIRPLPCVVEAGVDPRLPAFALAALGFLWVNASLLRALHQWIQVPWSLSGMLQSTITQTTLSIFWAILALAAMMFATRKSARPVWFAGSALLAALIAKLLFVDLSSVGSIERIVSFVGVGLLMLVIGYFSPFPRVHRERHEALALLPDGSRGVRAGCNPRACGNPAPQDFANGYPVVALSEASAYRITLPLAIYQGTVHE